MDNFLDSIPITLCVKDGKIQNQKRGRKAQSKNSASEASSTVSKSAAQKKELAQTSPAKPLSSRPPADPLDNYTIRGRVTYIGIQRCRECGTETRYIAGDLIEYFHKDKVAGINTIRTRAFSRNDYRFKDLPRRVETLEVEHCTCPSCIRIGEAFTVDFGKGQLSLPLNFPLTPEQKNVNAN